MKKAYRQLIEVAEESIQIEMNVAALYLSFSEQLSADTDFWWQLHLEEKNHAMLIRAAADSFIKRGKFPTGLVNNYAEELRKTNTKIERMVHRYKTTPLTRCEACRIALQIEDDAGEIHYERFMEKEAEGTLNAVLQKLNRDDKEHGIRIRQHLKSLPPD